MSGACRLLFSGPVLVETEGDTNRPAMQDAPMLRGVDPQTEGKISDLPRDIIEGKFDLSGRGLIVGRDFANNLRLTVGDHLSIYSVREIKKMKTAHDRKEDEVILPDDYEVRGIFDTGYYEFDARVIVVSLDNAQDLYDLERLGPRPVRDAERPVPRRGGERTVVEITG